MRPVRRPAPSRQRGTSQQKHYPQPEPNQPASPEGSTSQSSPVVKDARVHYADLKQQPHQPPPTPQQARTGSRRTRRHQPEACTSTADPSGPNSVSNHAPTNAGPMTRQPEHSTLHPRHLAVDDSTSETPPCASEHSPLVGVRAP